MSLVRKFLFAFISLALVLFSFSPAFAQEINSYELFWPITAGKVAGEPFYGLKLFKEKVRGSFIFGKFQKASYALFLTTKRVVETEKLIAEGKNELAEKTLDKALQELKKVSENLSLASGLTKEDIDGMNTKFGKLETFLRYLAGKSEPLKAKIQVLLDEVIKVNRNI